MTTYTCPKGHASTTDDFCDTCGAKIGGTMPIAVPSPPTSSAPMSVSAPPASAGAEICPNCGTPRTGTWRFCEDCGFDHTTGKVPTLDAPAPAATTARPIGRWTASVGPDRTYFDANAIEGVEFPVDAKSREVELPAPQVRIGRKSRSKGTDPELDLSAEPLDPGVSHSHALLTLNIDGVWLVSDLGSTNGTYINDEPRPLTAGQSRSLGDGDRVHVGAWTTITLHAPTQLS
jgi:FHA domain/Double zinc ribbon